MRLAAILAGAATLAVLSGPAQAHDWGGGTCVGYGCDRHVHDDRPVRSYRRVETIEERPVRIIERRSDHIERDDWDDDEED